MKDLYIDCDGVIFDTIKVAFNEMREIGVNLKDESAIDDYFKNCDWSRLIEISRIINDSIEKIKILSESGDFKSVNVATHRCSYLEGVIKTEKFKELIPNIKIITIPRKIAKHFAVPASNHILIDDAKSKIIDWINAGGIGILFSEKVNRLIYPDELDNQGYYITNDLLDALVVNSLEKDKTLKK